MSDPDLLETEVSSYLSAFDIPDLLFDELKRYQHLMLRGPFDLPAKASFTMDWHAFFTRIVASGNVRLQERGNTVTITPKRSFASLPDYAKETVWFGRRRGETIYHGAEVTVSYEDNVKERAQ